MASWRQDPAVAAGTPPGPAVLTAIGVVTAAATAAAITLAYGGPDVFQRELRLLLLGWATVPFIGAGIIAWRRRPDSRFGPLLIVLPLATRRRDPVR